MKEINNNIRESRCSFEVSKLLKEKGFGVPTGFYWAESLTESCDEEDGYSGPFGWKKGERSLESGHFYNDDPLAKDNTAWFTCSAPTHALAIEWIKQNYGSDKIKHITYNWTSSQIDNELVLILEKCGNQ